MVHRTNHTNSDTDGDGVNDFDEVTLFFTDPLKADSDKDGDGLTDAFEILTVKSDPNSFDTDGDGLDDGTEHRIGSDPLNDLDRDGLKDDEELALGTDPNNGDSDFDGVNDFDEGTSNIV